MPQVTPLRNGLDEVEVDSIKYLAHSLACGNLHDSIQRGWPMAGDVVVV